MTSAVIMFSLFTAAAPGCFHMNRHYENGEQIITGEPCLNCTCRDNKHICSRKVCPYVKPLNKNCTAKKLPGQCCLTATCDEGKNFTSLLLVGESYPIRHILLELRESDANISLLQVVNIDRLNNTEIMEINR